MAFLLEVKAFPREERFWVKVVIIDGETETEWIRSPEVNFAAFGVDAKLDEAGITATLRQKIRVFLSDDNDNVVGTAEFAFVDVFRLGTFDTTLPCGVRVKVSAGNDLADALLGGALVRVDHCAVPTTRGHVVHLTVRRSSDDDDSPTITLRREQLDEELPDWIGDPAGSFVFLSMATVMSMAQHPENWILAVRCPGGEEEEESEEEIPLAEVLRTTTMTTRKADLESDKGTRLTITLESHLPLSTPHVSSSWDGMRADQRLDKGLEAADAVPERRQLRLKVPRDVVGELKTELDAVAASVAAAYDSSDMEGTVEAQSRWLTKHLAGREDAHDGKLRLLPRIQRVLRNRCRARPVSQDDEMKLIAECFDDVVRLLDKKQEPAAQKVETPTTTSPISEEAADLDRHLILADDAEANGAWAVALAEHKQRLAIAATRKLPLDPLWIDFAKFHLRAHGSNGLPETKCLEVALDALVDHDTLRAAILLELGRPRAALAMLHGHETSLAQGLKCVLYDAMEDGVAAREAIAKAASYFAEGPMPMYKGVGVMLATAEFLLDASLKTTAHRARSIADRAAATAKARTELHGRPPAPRELQSTMARVVARLCLLNHDVDGAVSPAAEAVEKAPTSIPALMTYGDVLYAKGDLSAAAVPLAQAISLYDTVEEKKAPLRLRARHGYCLLQTGQHREAKDAYLAGTTEWPDAGSLFLGAGVAMLRLGDFDDADKVLRIATMRTPRSPLPHGYLALLHLIGDDAEQSDDYAMRVLDLALRLDLQEASLLRELGNTFYELGRYSMAEALFRRAVVCETGTSARSHTQKRLADVLQAQNQTAAAIAEYERALEAAAGATSSSPDDDDDDDLQRDIGASLDELRRAVGVVN